MTVYGFNDKGNAQALNRFASEVLGKTGEGRQRIGEDALIVKIPDGETLDARTGEDVGTLLCEIQQLGTDATLSDSGRTCLVYNRGLVAFESGEYVDVVRQKSLWIAMGKSGKSAGAIQFRLKSGWNDSATGGTFEGSGVSTATALTATEGVEVGSELTVYDFKKLFQNAVGSDEQVDTVGGSIGWANKVGSVWIVAECTQKINRYEATIAKGLCTGNWGESLSVTNPVARSVWPYTDPDPAVSGTGELDVINVHGLTANGGQVWIEFQQDPTAIQDPTNSTVPYDEGISPTSGRWVITDVEIPVANYIQCKWNGTAWDFSQGDNVYDGIEPDAEFNVVITTPDHLNLLGENGGSACLDPETMGLARIDRSASSPTQLSYFVCMTSSSLNGEVHEASIAGTLSPSNSSPPVDEEIIVVDGCEVQYKRIGKTFVFGSPNQTGPCEITEEVIEQPFKNWVDSTIVESIEDVAGELKMKMLDIKTCSASPSSDQDLPLVSMDVVNDVYCSGDSLVKDYKTIKFFGSVENSASGVAIDTSCIEIDYTQIINYPDVPYIDYYDIFFPLGCDPCGPEPTGIGCCKLFDDNGDLISQQDGLYLPECQADFGSEATAVSYTFDEGESCGGSSGCDGMTVSNFDMSGLFAGTCSISFTQVGTAIISGGSATINVTWSTNTTGFPDPDTAGTVTLTTDGSTWSWTSGTIPFAGGTTSNTDSPNSSACVGVTSGTNTGSGHTGACSSSSINGFYSFTVS